MSQVKWVVVVTDTSDMDNVVCQVVSEEYETEQEANDFVVAICGSLGSEDLIEVCTVEEAAACVTE